jgi:chromosome partitioning protein
MEHKIYLIGNEKGGVGKTTLAFNLAIMRVKAGKPVLLVDTDKQSSSSMWATLRAEAGHQPPLLTVEKRGKMIGYDLAQLRMNYEIIVDAGGSDSVELRQAIAVADRWVIPVRAGQLDLFSMAKMAQLQIDVEDRVGRGPDALVVLNAVNSSTREGLEARELLADNPKMPVWSGQLADRVALRRAVMMGCGLMELTGKDASPAANAEMGKLYESVFGEPYVEAA